MIDPISHGAIVAHLLFAGLLTLVVGAVLLLLYRRAVRRWMGVATGSSTAASVPLRPPTAVAVAPPAALFDLRDATDKVFAKSFRSPTFVGAAWGLRRAAVVYALAGFAHAATATILQILFGQFDFLPVRASVVFWANAWPVVLTLVLLWGADRRRQLLTVAAYFAVLAILALIIELGPTPPLALSSIPALAEPKPGTA